MRLFTLCLDDLEKIEKFWTWERCVSSNTEHSEIFKTTKCWTYCGDWNHLSGTRCESTSIFGQVLDKVQEREMQHEIEIDKDTSLARHQWHFACLDWIRCSMIYSLTEFRTKFSANSCARITWAFAEIDRSWRFIKMNHNHIAIGIIERRHDLLTANSQRTIIMIS